MSWSLSDPCYQCLRTDKCEDVAKIRKAIEGIHFDPNHVELGGAGTVMMICNKKEDKYIIEQAVKKALKEYEEKLNRDDNHEQPDQG